MNETSSKKNWKLLLVDDTPANLAALRSSLEPEGYSLAFAKSGDEALEIIPKLSPDLVMLDVMMPGINGFETCRRIKKNSKTKAIPVIFITSMTETKDIVEGFRAGGVDYIGKPFQKEEVCARVETHLEILGLRRSLEKENQRVTELLEKTLNGTIELLIEILSSFDPVLFGKASHLKDTIRFLAQKLNIKDSWELEAAGMLSQIGYVAIPPKIMTKARQKKALSSQEEEMLAGVPKTGANLLAHLPNFKQVSKIVLYQNKRFDGWGYPEESAGGKDIPLGARLLKILWDLVQLETEGASRADAMKELKKRKGWYDPAILDKVLSILKEQEKEQKAKQAAYLSVNVADLHPGYILAEDLVTLDGEVLFESGDVISPTKIALLENHSKVSWQAIKQPVMIRKPTG